MNRLIWIYAVCKSLVLLPMAVKELKGVVTVIMFELLVGALNQIISFQGIVTTQNVTTTKQM